MDVRDWYRVRVTDAGIALDVAPPRREAWHADILWGDIIRVCFRAEPLLSDGLYLFTKHRPESYAVPVEAEGGSDLVEQLLKRKLFDAELLIRAAAETEGVFCWPPIGGDAI